MAMQKDRYYKISVEKSQWGLEEEQVILIRDQERFLGIGDLEKSFRMNKIDIEWGGNALCPE